MAELVDQLAVEQAGKVAVQALVAADELVGEAEARHEAALLEPEDGAEGAREEDALDGGEGHAPLGEARRSALAPLSAQRAFFWTQGTVSMALRSWFFSSASLTYVSMSRE